jgi:hypothetical protein
MSSEVISKWQVLSTDPHAGMPVAMMRVGLRDGDSAVRSDASCSVDATGADGPVRPWRYDGAIRPRASCAIDAASAYDRVCLRD